MNTGGQKKRNWLVRWLRFKLGVSELADSFDQLEDKVSGRSPFRMEQGLETRVEKLEHELSSGYNYHDLATIVSRILDHLGLKIEVGMEPDPNCFPPQPPMVRYLKLLARKPKNQTKGKNNVTTPEV